MFKFDLVFKIVPCLSGLVIPPGDSQSVTLQSISPPGSNPIFLNVSHNIAPVGSPPGEYMVIPIS